jgi:hypothetical protein
MNKSFVRSCSAMIAMVVMSASSPGDEPTMTVDCSCQTKKNPSWCETNIGDFENHTFAVTGFRKPGNPLDAGALALFCQRHADAICQCSDVKYFKGVIGE